MQLELRRCGSGTMAYLNTGEPLCPSEPYPKEYMFDMGLQAHFTPSELLPNVLEPINRWLEWCPTDIAMEYAKLLINVGCYLRKGTIDIEEPADERFTSYRIFHSVDPDDDVIEHVNQYIAIHGIGVIESLEKYFLHCIGDGTINEDIASKNIWAPGITFTESQLTRLAVATLFIKAMIPLANTLFNQWARLAPQKTEDPWGFVLDISDTLLTYHLGIKEDYLIFDALAEYIGKVITATDWDDSEMAERAELGMHDYVGRTLPMADFFAPGFNILSHLLDTYNHRGYGYVN